MINKIMNRAEVGEMAFTLVWYCVPFGPTIVENGLNNPNTKAFALLDTLRYGMLEMHHFVNSDHKILVGLIGGIGYSVLGIAEFMYHIDGNEK